MASSDPRKSVENIVQLESARRNLPTPTLNVQRPQATSAVLFTSWVATRDRVAASLFSGTKRLLLTGPAGTGKTVLVEHVARVLRAAGRTVTIQLADADPAPPPDGVTLIVDEADRLSSAKLKQLVEESAGTVVLTGLAPLVRRVASGTVQMTLEPLGPIDAQDYIARWLALNGRTPAELDSKAVRALVELSGGVPRLLSTLLAAGAWMARNGNAPIIQAVHIQEAAELRSVLGPPAASEIAIIERRPVRQGRAVWSVLLTGVVLAGATVAIAPRLFPAETERARDLALPLIEQMQRWLGIEPEAPPAPPQTSVQTPVDTSVQTSAPAPAPAPVEPAPEPVTPAPPATTAPPPPVAAAPEPTAPTAELAHSEPEPEPAKPASEPAPPPPEPPQPASDPPTAAQDAPPSEPIPDTKPPEATATVEAPPPPAPAAPPSLPRAAATEAPTLPIETIEFLLRRGREMFALGDVSAARLLFVRAAEGGSAEAMFEAGQAYDPAILTTIGAVRLADRAEALRWYRRAAASGNHAAERLLPK